VSEPRGSIPAAAEAALWVISNGQCYYPSCPAPIIVETRKGVYRKNSQIAHIAGVRPGAPRYDENIPAVQRESFSNLMVLCLPHHGEVDDRKTGARLYPTELLLKWKHSHEGRFGSSLAQLGRITDDYLMELMVGLFTPPLERLQRIADQLEQTGQLTAGTVDELRQIVAVLSSNAVGVDAGTARDLAYAAEVLEGRGRCPDGFAAYDGRRNSAPGDRPPGGCTPKNGQIHVRRVGDHAREYRVPDSVTA
jgi:hypothetical protein